MFCDGYDDHLLRKQVQFKCFRHQVQHQTMAGYVKQIKQTWKAKQKKQKQMPEADNLRVGLA
jgi:hypothetical protein